VSPPGTAGTTEDALKPPHAVLPPSPFRLPERAQCLPGLWGELRLRPPVQGGRGEEPRDWGAGKAPESKTVHPGAPVSSGKRIKGRSIKMD